MPGESGERLGSGLRFATHTHTALPKAKPLRASPRCGVESQGGWAWIGQLRCPTERTK